MLTYRNQMTARIRQIEAQEYSVIPIFIDTHAFYVNMLFIDFNYFTSKLVREIMWNPVWIEQWQIYLNIFSYLFIFIRNYFSFDSFSLFSSLNINDGYIAVCYRILCKISINNHLFCCYAFIFIFLNSKITHFFFVFDEIYRYENFFIFLEFCSIIIWQFYPQKDFFDCGTCTSCK